MNKSEEYANIVKANKGTLWSRFYYKHVLRKCKKAAKRGYIGRWFGNTFFNPYIKKKLKEDEGFKIKEKKGKVRVRWEKSKNKDENKKIDVIVDTLIG